MYSWDDVFVYMTKFKIQDSLPWTLDYYSYELKVILNPVSNQELCYGCVSIRRPEGPRVDIKDRPASFK